MKSFFLFVFTSLLIFLNVYGQKSARLDSLFTALYKGGQFNGNVLIAEKGQIILEKSYGYADFESKIPLDTETIFDFASVSKAFTAAGILLLQKQNQLNIKDPISKYIPELDFYKGVTIENLIHHVSGLPDFMQVFQKHWNKHQFATNQDIVNQFQKYRPEINAKPGEKFEYSNTGYALLGLIIERASGESYAAFLKKNIFEPLRMTRTQVYRYFYDEDTLANYAIGNIKNNLDEPVSITNLPDTNYRYYLDGIVGAGQIKSTVKDLFKWDRALKTQQLFTDEEKELLFSPIKNNENQTISYGYGWVIYATIPQKIVYHPGRWSGYLNHFELDLSNDKTIIILQNNDLQKTRMPKYEVRDILYETEEVSIDSSLMNRFIGDYYQSKQKVSISKEKDHLLFTSAEGDAFVMRALGGNSFSVSRYLFDIYLNFSTDENGRLSLTISAPDTNFEKSYLKENAKIDK